MTARNYSNKATPATLGGGISSSDTSLSLSTVSGLPASFPYTLVIEPDSVNAEVVSCTALAGTIATVTRGQDGTTAVAHSAGAAVYHDHSARDFQEPQDHIVATVAHGATGAVVGTTNTQTLTNKTVDLASNTVTMTKAQLNTAVSDADVASLTGAETLTNKTVALGSNTVSGTTAQFNTANTDGDFATLAGSETLTNKTLTAPTLTGTTTATDVKSNQTTGSSSRAQKPWGLLSFSTASQSITTNTYTTVNFDAAENSSGDTIADTSTDRLTAPIDGLYLVTAQATLDAAFADLFIVSILNSSGSAIASQKTWGGGLTFAAGSASWVGTLLATNYVQMQVRQHSGSTANLVKFGTTPPGTSFSMYYLGPKPT